MRVFVFLPVILYRVFYSVIISGGTERVLARARNTALLHFQFGRWGTKKKKKGIMATLQELYTVARRLTVEMRGGLVGVHASLTTRQFPVLFFADITLKRNSFMGPG